MKRFKDYFELYSRRRITVFVTCMMLAVLVLSVRLFFIMIVKGDYYDERATNIQERERSIKAERGVI